MQTQYPGMGHLVAAQGEAYAYSTVRWARPLPQSWTPSPGPGQVRALWFDPRTGEEAVFAILPPEGSNFFVPPTQGKGCDWF